MCTIKERKKDKMIALNITKSKPDDDDDFFSYVLVNFKTKHGLILTYRTFNNKTKNDSFACWK